MSLLRFYLFNVQYWHSDKKSILFSRVTGVLLFNLRSFNCPIPVPFIPACDEYMRFSIGNSSCALDGLIPGFNGMCRS